MHIRTLISEGKYKFQKGGCNELTIWPKITICEPSPELLLDFSKKKSKNVLITLFKIPFSSLIYQVDQHKCVF